MSKRAKTAIFLILLAVLCAAVYLFTLSLPKGIDDDSEVNLKRVVEGMFTELTDAEYENVKEAELTASENFTLQSELPQWVTDRFKPYMTDECFDRFIASAQYDAPYMAYIHVIDLNVEDFKVTAGNGQYDFTAMVSHNYLKDPVEISGSAQTDKNGKISSLEIRGYEDVYYPMGLSSQLRLD